MILCCCKMLRNVKLSQDLKFDTRNNIIADSRLILWYISILDIFLFLSLLESGYDDDNNYGDIRYDNKIHF